jgi:hypothetical protein
MNNTTRTLAMSLLAGVFLLSLQAANAQTTNSQPPATATRPAKSPAEETSLPNNSPPATTGQATGEASRDPTVKKMNEDAKAKVERQGK